MRSVDYLAVWLLVLGGLGAALEMGGQQVPPPIERQVPALTVTAREVVLDVVAMDRKGHSIQGLKAGDFRLVEDDVPQTIKDASEHSALSATAVAALDGGAKLPVNSFTSFAPQGNTNSVTVIFIDAMDSPVVAQMYLRQQLIAFMKTVPAGNTFAIFEMDTALRLVQGFTSDPAMLLKAVESKREDVSLPNWMHTDSARREQMLSAALETMGRYLAGYPGRKNLVWFAGSAPKTVMGLSRNPFPDAVDFDTLTERAANALSLSRVAVYPIDDRGLEVYADYRFGHGEMERVAEATGGKAFYNTNGLKQALAEVTDTGSNYYTVAYSPTNPVWNAHHRTIKLTLAGRDGVLLYRHRYFARKERKAQRVADRKSAAAAYVSAVAAGPVAPAAGGPAEGQAVAPLQVAKVPFDEAMELGAIPSGELVFNVSVTAAAEVVKPRKGEPAGPDNFLREDLQKKPFREYRLLYTVDPAKVSFALTPDGRHAGHLDFVVVVYDAQAEALNSLISSSDMSLGEETYEKIVNRETPLEMEQAIAVPGKGSYFLRMGVHDTEGDLVGTVEVPVDTVQLGVAGPGQVLGP